MIDPLLAQVLGGLLNAGSGLAYVGGRIWSWLAVALLLAGIGVSGARANEADRYPGPILGEVQRVIDGDTVVVDAYIWPNTQASDVAIRVLGIDTPERRGKCENEKALAEQAKQLMREAFSAGSIVELYAVEPDKYGGRYLAEVRRRDGLDWADYIQSTGLAVPYWGRGPKNDWCAQLSP